MQGCNAEHVVSKSVYMNILVVNGPNLNLLGKREPTVYGNTSFEEYFETLKSLFSGQCDLTYYQSNHEGFLIDKIQEVGFSIDGIVLNAGALTHTSVALRDAIAAIETKVIEVHISNIHARESFRHVSMIAPVCKGSIIGLGLDSYKLAIQYILDQGNKN